MQPRARFVLLVAELVESSKAIWNDLRKKDNTKEKVRELTDELYEMVKGKMGELGKKHDASRVVQAVVQFGTEQQRLAGEHTMMRSEDRSALTLVF